MCRQSQKMEQNRTVPLVFQGNIWAWGWRTALCSLLCVLEESLLRAESASQNLQCTQACTRVRRHTQTSIYLPAYAHMYTHSGLLSFAVCQYQLLIHKPDQELIPASCLGICLIKTPIQERRIQMGSNPLARIRTKSPFAAVEHLDPLEFSQTGRLCGKTEGTFFKRENTKLKHNPINKKNKYYSNFQTSSKTFPLCFSHKGIACSWDWDLVSAWLVAWCTISESCGRTRLSTSSRHVFSALQWPFHPTGEQEDEWEDK